MRRHDTPASVAASLLKWAPASATSVLDPAVGRGALLSPLVEGPLAQQCVVTCVDRDPSAINDVVSTLGPHFPSGLHAVVGDFLGLSRADIGLRPEGERFDCIVMNPPFDGRRWIRATTVDETWNRCGYRGEHISVEAAFVVKSISLLNKGGRLLAILPPSVISGNAARPVREHLLERGRIECVHELPAFTFPAIEARIYFLVFDKKQPRKVFPLYNHDLITPDLLTVRKLEPSVRLDYGFYSGDAHFSNLRSCNTWGWAPLSEYARISRGSVSMPDGVIKAIHISDYSNGFWNSDRLSGVSQETGITVADAGDILVARVGRSALSSVGLLKGPDAPITDCVLRVRPNSRQMTTRLLFAIRSVTLYDKYLPLLKRNSGGAKYVSSTDLGAALVPIGLSEAFPDQFRRYSEALEMGDFVEMQRCEEAVQARISKFGTKQP